MLTEVVVKLEDRIGALADLGELLGGHGVDIRALAVLTVAGGRALAHLVVEPADVAVRVLREHDLVPERVREVLSATCRRPAACGVRAGGSGSGSRRRPAAPRRRPAPPSAGGRPPRRRTTRCGRPRRLPGPRSAPASSAGPGATGAPHRRRSPEGGAPRPRPPAARPGHARPRPPAPSTPGS